MSLVRFMLLAIPLLFVPISPKEPAPETAPEIYFGPLVATVGLNPQTGQPSGWYTSEVSIQILAPADTTANGKPLVSGYFTISEEGQHEVEFQPGPFGQANAVTQFVNIDKFPPQVEWLTRPNTTMARNDSLSAEIIDPISGICAIQTSFDAGQTWESQFFPAHLQGQAGIIHETTWSWHLINRDFPPGEQVILLRAQDCAGNTSPDSQLAFQVQ